MKIAKDQIQSTLDLVFKNGKFATVKFIKKDGSERDMTCRKGVKCKLSGGKSTTAHKPNLVTVYDVNAIDYKTKTKGAYRCINKDTLISIKGNKEIYYVK